MMSYQSRDLRLQDVCMVAQPHTLHQASAHFFHGADISSMQVAGSLSATPATPMTRLQAREAAGLRNHAGAVEYGGHDAVEVGDDRLPSPKL